MKGVGVSPGIGDGPAYILATQVPEPPANMTYHGDADDEKARAQAALAQVAGALEARGNQVGGEAKAILQAQSLIAADPGLAVGVKSLIDRGVAAPRAVYDAFAKYREMLKGAGGYLGERVADLDDVRDRAIALLTGQPLPGLPTEAARPYVLIARDLAPADTAVLTKDVVAAFVTEEGGPTSHTAILARAMGVPAVVACPGATTIAPGARVLVDGSTGDVRQAPSDDEVAEAVETASARQAVIAGARGPGLTRDGHRIPLLANIGGPDDLDSALANGAEGVGLYRTEFLFLDRSEAPTIEEQEAAYRPVLEAFPGGTVIVRALDAGADKPLAFLPPASAEPNPALGSRGIRLFQTHPEVMETQLNALAAAAVGTEAEVRVMAPMVATAEEARWFVSACRTAGLSSAGVMIEVPAAALRAEELAAVADFLSVGTNDLAQYAFAADRQVGTLSALQNPWQPVLLDLVASAAVAASDDGKPCGVCGEAAADPALACVLAGLGVTSLSMSASALPAVRAALAAHTLSDCQLAGQAARAASTASHARAAARTHLPGLASLGL